MTSLNQIKKPVASELSEFNDYFKKSLKSDIRLLDLITTYVLKQKGKKIRPLLVFLSAKLAGGVTERTYRGAVLVELLHTATLVHDDVVDASDKRRGFPSINAIWKNKIAVLLGDYLLAKGLQIAVEGEDHDFLAIITDTVKRMSEGELLQIQKARKLDIDEETYFRIIKDKTASLIETCCRIGVLSASSKPEYEKAIEEYGESLGVSFQIRDDVLDYEGTTKLFGKPIGGDIKERKITLPLIHSLNNVEKSEKKKILKLIKKNKKKDSVKNVIGFVHNNGGINYAVKTAEGYAERAYQSLDVFEDSPAKISLKSLVEFVIGRFN